MSRAEAATDEQAELAFFGPNLTSMWEQRCWREGGDKAVICNATRLCAYKGVKVQEPSSSTASAKAAGGLLRDVVADALQYGLASQSGEVRRDSAEFGGRIDSIVGAFKHDGGH